MNGKSTPLNVLASIGSMVPGRTKWKRNSEERVLQDKISELEQLLSIASHDLREPARTISGFAHLIRLNCKDRLDRQHVEYLNTVVEASVRLQNMVSALLDYGGIDQEQQFTELDCNEVLSDVLTDLSSLIAETEASIQFDRLPILKVSRIGFPSLLQNLITNGIKYHRPEIAPELQISVREMEHYWKFAVTDNGIGIATEDQNRIFQPFLRLKKWSAQQGIGLGLTYCKKIVDRHKGIIWVDSNVYSGSTFYFTVSKYL